MLFLSNFLFVDQTVQRSTLRQGRLCRYPFEMELTLIRQYGELMWPISDQSCGSNQLASLSLWTLFTLKVEPYRLEMGECLLLQVLPQTVS